MKPTPDQFKEYWNQHTELVCCRTMGAERRKMLKKRNENPDWVNNWTMVISKMAQLPFYCGNGGRGWRAKPEYILRNDSNYNKILEEGMPLQCARCGKMTGLKQNKFTKLMYCAGSPRDRDCHLYAKTNGREGSMSEGVG